jgi:hypothetical protein
MTRRTQAGIDRKLAKKVNDALSLGHSTAGRTLVETVDDDLLAIARKVVAAQSDSGVYIDQMDPELEVVKYKAMLQGYARAIARTRMRCAEPYFSQDVKQLMRDALRRAKIEATQNKNEGSDDGEGTQE